MQINNNVSLSSIASDLGLNKPSPKQTSQSGAGQDQVQISSLAQQYSSNPSALSQLQAAFESGTYNVSSSQIANSLISSMMQS